MRNLWVDKRTDGQTSGSHGANRTVELTVRYKRNGDSIEAVKLTVIYNNGQPIINITGDPNCNWHIGGTPGLSREKTSEDQRMLFDPPI